MNQEMTTIPGPTRRIPALTYGRISTSLLLGCLLGSGCARQSADAPTHSLSEWRALQNPPRAPEMSSDAEVTLNGYGLTAPAGMELTRSGKLTPTIDWITLRWHGPLRPDQAGIPLANQSRTALVWELLQARPGVPGTTLDRLASALAQDSLNNAARHSQYVATPVETCSVHGLPGFRYYWKGVFPLTHKMNHGFVYYVNDARTVIYLRSTDAEPFSTTTLPLCEKAALTFHKL